VTKRLKPFFCKYSRFSFSTHGLKGTETLSVGPSRWSWDRLCLIIPSLKKIKMAESKNDLFTTLLLQSQAQDAKRTPESVDKEAAEWMGQIINFGKYKGKNMRHADMYLADRSYFLFLVRQARGYNLAKAYLYDHIIAKLFPTGVPKRQVSAKKEDAKAADTTPASSLGARQETTGGATLEDGELPLEELDEEEEVEVAVEAAPSKKRTRRSR